MTDIEKHEWQCPREGCDRFIMAYSKSGIEKLIEEHLYVHSQQDREDELKRRQEEVENLTKELASIQPNKNDNLLVLTAQDIAFLKTRHIKIDEDIEFDPCLELKPSKGFLPQALWKKILEAACRNSQNKS
jgi:hypothetical protein